jgi:lauroyl/myristoyl acyltransferase
MMQRSHLFISLRNQVLRCYPRFTLRALASLANLRFRIPTALGRELELNLSLAFPALGRAEIGRLARNVLVSNWVDAAAQFRLELLSREDLRRETLGLRIIGAEHLAHACAAGQPVILVTPHYGSFMLAALRVACAQQEKPIYFFYNPIERNPYADTSDALIDRINDRCVKIHHDRKGVITVVRALRKGAMLCLMPDQVTPGGEVAYVPFFGRFFGVMQGAAFLALKTNALIMPVYCRADDCGAPVLECRPPLVPQESPLLDDSTRIYQTTAALFAEIERQFRLAPAHWRYWTQFRSRSLISPVPPQSRAEVVVQLCEIRRQISGNAMVEAAVTDWQKIMRELGAMVGS